MSADVNYSRPDCVACLICGDDGETSWQHLQKQLHVLHSFQTVKRFG